MSSRNFRNEADWLTPALALAVWAAHFSLLWAASSAFPGEPAARWIAATLTIVAALALWRIWRRAAPRALRSLPALGVGIASAGVLFDFLPAVIG